MSNVVLRSPWTLQVTIVRAHALPKLHGGFHKVDSFVKMRVGHGPGSVTYQTNVVRGTYDPDYGRQAFAPTAIEQIFTPVTLEVREWFKKLKTMFYFFNFFFSGLGF